MNRLTAFSTSALATLGIVAPSLAQTAGMMSFQGLIRDNGGVAAQGAITLQLQIVDAGDVVIDASGNGSVGPEDTYVVNTTAEQGIVSVKYGPIAPSAFNGSERRLKVTVTSPGGYPVLSPVEIVTPPAIAEQLNARGSGIAAAIVSPSGSVGVGDIDPALLSQKLNVQSLSTFGSGLSLRSRDTGGRNWSVLSSGSGNTGGPGNLQFLLDSSPIVTTTSSGFVGIGTTSPNERLSVAGSVALDGFNFFYARATPGSNSNATSLGFSGQIGGVLTLSNNGNNEIRAGRGATGGQLRFFVNNTADPFTASNGVEAMTIASNGNVGIGTNNPNCPFNVSILSSSDSSKAAEFTLNGAPGASIDFVRNSTQAGQSVRRFQIRGGNDFNFRASFGLGMQTNHELYFFTNDTERFRIAADGNVGIGTSTPARTLDIASSGQQEIVFRRLDGTVNNRAWRFSNGGASFAFEAVNDALTGGANILNFLRDGTVGFGRVPTGAGAWRIEVEGAAFKTAGGADWNIMSDRRIKTDIQPIENALELISKVQLHSFRYTPEYRSQHPSIEDRRHMNVIAQEFGEVFPEYVKESGETLPDGERLLFVDPWPLTIYGVAATQELHRLFLTETAQQRDTIERQQVEIESQRQQLDRQQAQLADLLARIEKLEQTNRLTGADQLGSSATPAMRPDAMHPHYAQPLGEKR